MTKSELRVVSYVRDQSVQKNKFNEFDRMIKTARGNADAIAISSPEVLGDNYEELLTTLNELAAAELMLIVVPPSQRATANGPMN